MSNSKSQSLPAASYEADDGSPLIYHPAWDSSLVELWIRGLAWRLSHSPILQHLDRSDIEQELRLHLFNRAKYYSDTRGGHWSFFVTARLREAAGSIIEFYRSQIRCPDRPLLQLHRHMERDPADGDPIASCPEAVDGTSLSAIRRCELREDVAVVLAMLKPKEQELCRSLMRMSIAGTARELGLARSTVVDAIRRLRSRFDDAGLRDFL